jgi:glucose-1-phosphate adenylyltransferase
MKTPITMILAGGKSERLLVLTRLRSKTAMPFGGKYRIIDFPLSNCVHSGIYDIGILAQYTPESLHHHIRRGENWDLDRSTGGVRILQPYIGAESNWYRGTADALYQNIEYLERERYDQALILSSDHVYKMNYADFMDFHIAGGKPATIACARVPEKDMSRFGSVRLGKDGLVESFAEKPETADGSWASMGIYAFEREFLVDALKSICGVKKLYDIVYDLIIPLVEKREVAGYEFQGYWEDIGTVKSYYYCNMELLSDFPRLNLYDARWPIITRPSELPPMKIIGGRVTGSLVDNGCIIVGEVSNSILFPGVYVDSGAKIADSIVFSDVYVGQGAAVNHAILDKYVYVGDRAIVGCGDKQAVNQSFPDLLDDGLTIVGKGTVIPEKARIGRNCCLDCFLRPEDLTEVKIPSGSTIDLKEEEIFRRGDIHFPLEVR